MTKNNPKPKESEELSFEKAFSHLEEILEQLNSGQVSLDDSLKLYEEADKLISSCGKRLTQAERKIEKLIKNRSGEVVTGENQDPLSEDFSLNTETT